MQTAYKFKLEVYIHAVSNVPDAVAHQALTVVLSRSGKSHTTQVALNEQRTARFNELLSLDCTLYKGSSDTEFSSKAFEVEVRAVRWPLFGELCLLG